MTVEEVPLANLHENDYNPRHRFDDAAMEDLKASIENVGLVQPPTVRPLDNGDYEVISGTRRYLALSELYGDDHEVPVYVRDVDDDEARWLAITENLEREDLDPIERALAFASYVWVSPDGDRLGFDEYIKEARGENTAITIPHDRNNESVQELAEKVPATGEEIRARLELLALPDDVQSMVAHEDLTIQAAVDIARLRQMPDADRRDDVMTSLAAQYRGEYVGEDRDALRDRVNTYLDDYKEEQERQDARLQEYEDLVDEREVKLRNELNTACEWYNQQDDVDEQLVPNGDGITDEAQQAIDAFQGVINELGGERLDRLDDREDQLRIDRDRLQKNIEVVRSEAHDRCPFCKAGVRIPDLEERVASYDEELEGIKQEKRELSDRREQYRDQRKAVRSVLNRYEDAVETLEQQEEAA